MSKHITRKTARNFYPHIIQAGYCELCHIGINQRDRIGYNAGVYGWNWDLIPVDGVPGVAVCTGYRGMIGSVLPKDVDAIVAEARNADCDYFNRKEGATREHADELIKKARAAFVEYCQKLANI